MLFKGDERLGRNDVVEKIAGYAGKDAKKLRTSLDVMHSRRILLRSDRERVAKVFTH